ncbi:hypothetical protein L6R53_10460 [Myxococcota bacterium]|nr:hypothetical protein [Myxococcota bacterium]
MPEPAPPDLLRCALPAPDPDLAAAARRPFLADHAVQALAAGREQPRAAAAAMAAWFRRTRRLGSRDRRLVGEIAYGVVRQEGLLARLGATDDAARVARWADLCEGHRLPELERRGPRADYATALSLPEEVAGEWLSVLGPEQAAALGQALAQRAPVYLRVDAAWGSREMARRSLALDGVLAVDAPGPWALELRERADVSTTHAYLDGGFEVQDLSSQALVAAIHAAHPLAAATVLDRCAGAGGKSLAMAALGARVQATDLRPAALHELARRAARAHHRIALGEPGQGYDVVLVDAPCTGTGRLRREPTLRWDLEPARYLAVQATLLADGAARVRPGGLLAYATCSLLAAENDPPAPAGFELLEAVVRWPHRDPGDGFGWRLWRRA